MLKLIIYLLFIVSVALSAAGIILSARLRTGYGRVVFSHLLYFEVFIYTFGFYGIWGQVVIRSFLSSLASPEILSRLLDLAVLFGLPFLVFAWFMLIRFSWSISGRNPDKWFVFWFLFFNLSVLLILGFFITRKNALNTASTIRYYFIIMNLVYFFIASYLIHLPWKGRSLIHDYDRKIISPSLFLIMIFQCVPLYFYSGQPWLAILFIFGFFLGNTFLPVYLSYGTMLPSFTDVPEKNMPFDEFCRKFDVSPRESDVIMKICEGLSNKEISDKLFISLQTVKDHTHRIYVKTNARNRVQLINMIKELKKPDSK